MSFMRQSVNLAQIVIIFPVVNSTVAEHLHDLTTLPLQVLLKEVCVVILCLRQSDLAELIFVSNNIMGINYYR